MSHRVKRVGEKSSRDGTDPDFGCTAVPTALQHNGPKVCASDTQKFHRTGMKNFVLKSQAFSLHCTVNGTNRA
jgi:hypothetical protein